MLLIVEDWTIVIMLTTTYCIISVTSVSFVKMHAYILGRLVMVILIDKQSLNSPYDNVG